MKISPLFLSSSSAISSSKKPAILSSSSRSGDTATTTSPSLTTSSPSSPSSSQLSFEDYLECHQSSGTIFTFYLWHILLLFIAIIFQESHLIKFQSTNISPFTLVRLISLIPIAFHLYHVLQKKSFPHWKPQPFRITTIQNAYLLSLISVSSAALIGTTLTHNCTLPLCIETLPRRVQPLVLFQNILIGIISPILVKTHSVRCGWFAYSISFSSSIIAATIVKTPGVVFFAIASIYLLGGVAIYDNEILLRQLYHNYVTQEDQIMLKLNSQNEKELALLKERQLRLLFGSVAHDLKSPLQGFTMELELLTSFVHTKDLQIQKSVQMLKNISNLMLMIVHRAVDYSKVSSGIPLVPSLETVNLSNTISWVLRCVGTEMMRNVPIRLEPFPHNLVLNILTDSQWLKENLLCLLSNAQKFTCTGLITIRCYLETKETEIESNTLYCHGISQKSYNNLRNSSKSTKSNLDVTQSERLRISNVAPNTPSQYLCFEIEDTGIGIDPSLHQELFQPFKQNQQQHSGGTGLGLFALMKRVKCLGGDCGVSGRRDQGCGTRFWFTIPYFPQPTSVNHPSTSSRHHVPNDFLENISEFETPERSQRKNSLLESAGNILLVEDSIVIQKTTSRALSKEGYVVDIARHGGECLEMVNKKQYDFILMDINMPIMDGIEATIKIREMEVNPPRPFSLYAAPPAPLCIIGISANGDTDTIQRSLDAGMNDFLLKPLSAAQLIECFQRLRPDMV